MEILEATAARPPPTIRSSLNSTAYPATTHSRPEQASAASRRGAPAARHSRCPWGRLPYGAAAAALAAHARITRQALECRTFLLLGSGYWDIAALIPIVSEAGGIYTASEGAMLTLAGRPPGSEFPA